MMYARNKRDAERYVSENYAGYDVERAVVECDCGESDGFRVHDADGELTEEICICNACWMNNGYHSQIESPGTLNEEELLNLLGFEPGIEDVEILRTVDVNDDVDFIEAKLSTEDDDMTVVFLHHKGKDWLFTPCDWHGEMPDGPDEIGNIKWRVNNTYTEGVIVDGVPMLAPWSNDPIVTTRKSIGDAIRAARESQELSVRDLAEKTRMSKNNIVRIEQGKYNYTIDTLTTIAHALGIRIEI